MAEITSVQRFSDGFRARASDFWARSSGVRKTWWFKTIAGLLVLAVAGWLLILAVFARDLPSVDSLKTYQPPLPTNVRALDGTPIYSFARERRVQLSFDEYPRLLINAYLSAEDRTFFRHGGLDYPGLVRAAIEGMIRQETPRGTSTITQQVAKNLLLTNEVSYTRKVREAILAYRIEDALSKEQILELYLNQIFLGRNAYGVQAAARAYFDKDVDQLALHEAAYLSILPKAPSNYRPERFERRAIDRRNWVLGEMENNGFITEAQLAEARAQPLGTIAQRGRQREPVGGYFLEDVRRSLIAKYGEDADDSEHGIYAGGLWVRTSLDPRLQELTASSMRDGLVRYDTGKGWHGPIRTIEMSDNWAGTLAALNLAAGYEDWRIAVVVAKSGNDSTIGFTNGETAALPGSSALIQRNGQPAGALLKPGDVIAVKQEDSGWRLRNVPEISGGMVVQNPHTGQVLAMQGGFDSRLESFNNATQAVRQPGSTIKPFVYSAALDAGMTPASIIVDGPFCVYQGPGLGNKCFRNFSGGSAGPQTMRWGIEQSRNLMTVRAASQTGMENVNRLIERVGIGDYPNYLSIALGAGDTTVLKMTNAFSTLANNGRQMTPTLIDYVQDRNGKIIYRADARRCERCNMADWDGKPMPRLPMRGKQVIDAMTAYQMVHILEGVVERGTATRLRELERPLFGKTGTTNGPTNVWFVGGSPDLVAGVYMGYNQPRSMGGYAQGGRIAAPIFLQFAKEAMKDMPVTPFRAPAGIRMVRIDRRSGRKVFGVFPTSEEAKSAVIWEAFKPESEPRRSIRREEVAKNAEKEGRLNGDRVLRQRRDSDFLAREGGIY